MPDLADGESVEMAGSGSRPYVIKNVGGVYSCSCPAWRNQSVGIERRTCKHIRKLRGDDAEEARVGGALPARPVKPAGEAGEGPPILLAETWDNALDLSGWWMSEKLDGVRAYWDGKQFLSRQGNIYHAPDWFLDGLPDSPLDGELWIDRKAFQRTVSIVRRQDRSDHWKQVRFLIFDAPAMDAPFEDRLAFLKDGMPGWKFAYGELHAHDLCRSVDHLREELRRVEALGGEGLMLRQPGSKYHSGRSATLLKVKTFLDDEAVVIAHEPGKGRHKGRLGALVVRLGSGKEFSVGTGFSDRQRESPPPVGTTITFRYQELSDAGIPRFPSFVGVRTDAPVSALPEPTPLRAKAPEPAPVVLSAPPAAGKKRYFECTEGTANKFWEIQVDGADLTTRWGKIAAKGQSRTKTYPSAEKAQAEADKLIEEKLDAGYVEK
jgi:DNA ligase-1